MATFRFNSKKSVDGPRQGNENDVVYIYTYVTEKTFDAYLFQLVETILEICKTKENSELEEIGEYRGMKLELQINVARQEFELFLKGKSEYKISLGNDIYGNITRIDNALSNIGKELEENKNELENTKKQFENAKIDVKIPFDKENELKEKSTRLDRVNALLKLDEKENIIMEDDERSEDDNLKSQDYDKEPIR